MAFVICPHCGERNGEFNPRCLSCDTLLPASSTGQSESWSGSSEAGATPLLPTRIDTLVGRHIEHYRIVELLGRGGMGEVYRAYDEALDRAVALKVIRSDKAKNHELRQRLHREAQSAKALHHPTIVHIYDVIEHKLGDCIVMELVEGRTLAEVLADGRRDISQIASLAREIAAGLAEAHEQGIVHRDLKVENIMVTPAGHARILDFGLAKRFVIGDEAHSQASLTVDGGVVGTFRSMSPEQAQGFKVDHRSDIFSLGTMLYEATTGRSPFHRGGLAATLAQLCIHRQTPARELNPEVPQSFSDLIDFMLEKNQFDRPQSVTEVAAALEDILIELTNTASSAA